MDVGALCKKHGWNGFIHLIETGVASDVLGDETVDAMFIWFDENVWQPLEQSEYEEL